jgi:hypothetical protein
LVERRMKRISGGHLSREAKATLLSSHAGDPRTAAGDRSFARQSTETTRQSRVSPPPARAPTGRVGRHRPDPKDDDSDDSLASLARAPKIWAPERRVTRRRVLIFAPPPPAQHAPPCARRGVPTAARSKRPAARGAITRVLWGWVLALRLCDFGHARAAVDRAKPHATANTGASLAHRAAYATTRSNLCATSACVACGFV